MPKFAKPFLPEEKPPEKPKDDTICIEPGCYEKKAPGQSAYCAKHMRSG